MYERMTMENKYILDFDFLIEILERNLNKYSEFMIDKIGFYSLEKNTIHNLRGVIKSVKNDEDFFNIVNAFLNSIKNGHTRFKNQKRNNEYTFPLFIRYIKGNYFIIYSENSNDIGRKVEKINNIDVNKYICSINDSTFQIDTMRKKQYRENLIFNPSLGNDVMSITVENNEQINLYSKENNEVRLDLAEKYQNHCKEDSEVAISNNGNLKFYIYEEILYIKVKSFNRTLVKADKIFLEKMLIR